MTERVGLPPIPGMTLNSLAMIKAAERDDAIREENDREIAASIMQSVFRMKFDKERVQKLRRQRDEKLQRDAAVVIECHLRGMVGRRIFKSMMEEEQARAITVIQARIRSKKGRLESEQLKRKKMRIKREHAAATAVQSIYRGKLSRRKFVVKGYEKRWRRQQQSMYEKTNKVEGLEGLQLTEKRGGAGGGGGGGGLTRIATASQRELEEEARKEGRKATLLSAPMGNTMGALGYD
jgi:hypothetical protein